MQITSSQMLMLACFGALSGTAVGASRHENFFAITVLAAFGVGCVAFRFLLPRREGMPYRFAGALGVFFLGAAVGFGRAQLVRLSLDTSPLRHMDGQTATFRGVISRYPDVRLSYTRFWLDVSAAETDEGVQIFRTSDETRILVTTDRVSSLSYGDTTAVSGTFRFSAPEASDGRTSYLAKDRIVGTLRAKKSVREGTAGSAWKRTLAEARGTIDTATMNMLPFREAALLKAMLVGDEGAMEPEFLESLNRSGLRHLVAVSGTNITVIAGILVAFGIAAGLWRWQAMAAAFLVVVGFVVMIGAPASAVRAALMGAAAYAQPLLGRRGSGIRSIVIVAAALALFSPLALRFDIGFQLSFLAAFGIVALGPLIRMRLRRLPYVFRETLATTLSAQIAVLPLLFVAFGEFSVIGPFTNLLIVPFVPIVTLWGFLAVAMSIPVSVLGTLAVLPILPFLTFLAWVAERGGSLPFATVSFPAFFLWPVSFLVFITMSAVFRRKKPRPIDLIGDEVL